MHSGSDIPHAVAHRWKTTRPDIGSAPRFLHRLTFPPFLVSSRNSADKKRREREREISKAHTLSRVSFLGRVSPRLGNGIIGGLYFDFVASKR